MGTGGEPTAALSHDEARRRAAAARAGHTGDEAAARRLVGDASARVRATALAALGRLGVATGADVAAALADPDPLVRRRACAVAATVAAVDPLAPLPLLDDPDPLVAEAAAWALGERGAEAAGAVGALARVASSAGDALCREAAVAALGAIGHPAGLPAVIAATADKPAVRRRAVIALAPFEGPEVEAALRRALEDRDWQVRQAAEDLLAGEDG
ncbi:MAG TPA: HEAT repeat domain-containing protein [Acidimicrobiales bacterium]|nr:HEAT repeat domain-containing protein [Acidimicrobiales bacterium]